MKLYSVHQENVVLCDRPTTYADLRRHHPGETFGQRDAPKVETVVCVIEGELVLETHRGAPLHAMQVAHIPAGQAWTAIAGAPGAKVLRVDSLHPGFDPAKALMPPLPEIEIFDIAAGLNLTFTDYLRSRVLNFAPLFADQRHFHAGADEVVSL